MSNKFEQLLDLIVNEENEKANELFHEIVVEKSREIYETLIAEEEEEEEKTEESLTSEEEEEEEEGMKETFTSEEDEEEETKESIYGEEEEEDSFPAQDATDDLETDTVDHDFGGEMDGAEDEGEPATKGDIDDLSDALEELKMEFEKLMAGEAEEPEHADMFGGEEEPSDMDGSEEEEEEEEEKSPFATEEEEGMKESRIARTQGEKMREYIEKVSVSMVDGEGVGSGRGDKAGQTGHDSGKSPISSGSGKPTSGAKAIPAPSDKHTEDGTAPKGKVGGLVKQGGEFVKSGTKNVAASANTKKPDGSKLSSVSKPGNAEGKPVGAGTGQSNVKGATNTKSIESGK